MALAAPDERRRMPIPALDRVVEPLFEHLDVGRVLSVERSPLNNALNRLGHVEPGASVRRPEQKDAMFSAPLHESVALMPCEIVQNEQHAYRWEKAIQLLGRRIDIPVLPASTFWDNQWCRGTLLENGFEFALEPRMQHRIGGVLHRLGTDFSGGRSQQGQQFGRLASRVLMGSTCRLLFGLPGGARLRNTLIGTTLVFAPQCQAEPLVGQIGPLNYRFFSCVYGS